MASGYQRLLSWLRSGDSLQPEAQDILDGESLWCRCYLKEGHRGSPPSGPSTVRRSSAIAQPLALCTARCRLRTIRRHRRRGSHSPGRPSVDPKPVTKALVHTQNRHSNKTNKRWSERFGTVVHHTPDYTLKCTRHASNGFLPKIWGHIRGAISAHGSGTRDSTEHARLPTHHSY